MTLDRPALRRSLTVCGPRPADDVWDRYVRPGRWAEWSPQIRSVRYPEPALRPGTTGLVTGPFGLPVRFRVVDVRPTGPVRSWSWSAWAGGVRLDLEHTVEGRPDGTRTRLTMRGFAPAVLAYLPVARWALHRLVARDE